MDTLRAHHRDGVGLPLEGGLEEASLQFPATQADGFLDEPGILARALEDLQQGLAQVLQPHGQVLLGQAHFTEELDQAGWRCGDVAGSGGGGVGGRHP